MLQRPNPWILFMGGIAIINAAFLVGGLKIPDWQRFTGAAIVGAMGVTSMGLGLTAYFKKKPPPPKFVSRRSKSRPTLPPNVPS